MTPYQAADRYADKLTLDGLAAKTIHRYMRYVHELGDMYQHIDVEDISPEMWLKWLGRITKGKQGKHLDKDTIAQRVTIAKRFTFWLADTEIIGKDPLARVKTPKRKDPIANDNVKWLTAEETQRMLAVAGRDVALHRRPQDQYRKLLCLGVLSYTGGRRAAVSMLRISDYDALSETPTLAFHEKGGKFIKKPVSRRLADLIREAHLAGVWDDPQDYLIPSIGTPRKPERDARAIYRIVKDVARDAGVNADVHTLRRSFACYFLESYPDQLTALKNLMGHSQVTTTEMYLRRMNRQKGMEVVVDLDWGTTETVGAAPPGKSAAPSAGNAHRLGELASPKGGD